MDRLTTEEYYKLPPEEKKEFVRELIHASKDEAAGIHAAFFNPRTGKAVGMSELADNIGEEQAIDMIMQAFEQAGPDNIRMENANIKELLEKKRRGECSKEELAMLDYMTSQISQQNNIQCEQGILEAILSIITFGQDTIKYQVPIQDMLSAITVLTLVNSLYREDGPMNKFKNLGADTASEMVHQVGEDIYDTWKASCTTMPDAELVILGLLHMASKIAHENNIPFAQADILAERLGISINEEECDSCDGCDECANGSNTSNVCQPATYDTTNKDQDMKDLLKE